MADPPYNRQGTPLDPKHGIRGWWVEYAHVFLFAPPPDSKSTQLKIDSGENCIGLNVVELATAFGIPPGDLILNNQIGSLFMRWEPGIPAPGAARAANYFFGLQIGGEVLVPIQIATIAGRA
jgi:hypothetical protein